jgi:1-acyl-sn-glycerol-3-phosphate acyltransferase
VEPSPQPESPIGPIRFVDPQPFWGEWMPTLVESFLIGAARLDTAGTERNIPRQGRLVVLLAPHSGWIEPVAVDACFERVGRPCPLWMTKGENRGLPRFFMGDRFIAINREQPEPSIVRILQDVLLQTGAERPHPAPALGTAIEGTRRGNPDDRSDIRTLGPFKTGLVRIAIRTRTPILPAVVLGSDRFEPYLQETWDEMGTWGALKTLLRLRVRRQPLTARILPVYTEHLEDERHPERPTRLRDRAEWHTREVGERLVKTILDLEPDYPVGGGAVEC